MDSPLCKICGDRHRLGSCPKFEVRDVRRLMNIAVKKKPRRKGAKRKSKAKGKAA